MQGDKELCINGGGTCEMVRDGYYIVNIICVIVGLVTFTMYIRPKVLHLQSLPLRAWRLAGSR
jgi:MFS transporter, PAT family, solute carrier family 33 (acetyl-CoA transportor), member 1